MALFSPFVELLGIATRQMEQGRAELALEVREQYLNSGGSVHGGVLATLADSAVAAAAFSTLKGIERMALTTELNLSYYRSTGSGTLVCKAEVIHQSQSLIGVEAQVHCEDKLLLAARAAFQVVPRRKALSRPDS